MTTHAPQAILVLGMHRSGTSAATRVLNLLGAGLGTRMMPPMPGSNEKGFWENLDAVDIDDRLLAGIGRSWHDVRAMPDGWTESVAAADAHAAITRLVQTDLGRSTLWAVKDPRMCRLAPIWLRAVADCGARPGVLFVVRHPREVAASLEARDGWAQARSLVLWMQHITEAERATRAYPRVMITFDQILEDWPGSVARIARDLGVTWPRSVNEARDEINAFLDVGARHHAAAADRSHTPPDVPALPPPVAELFTQCVRVSVHDAGGWSELRALSDEFERFATLYGACMDDFVGYATAATGRVQHAGTLSRSEDPLGPPADQLSRAFAALSTEGGDLAAVKQCLTQQAGMVERLSRAVEGQWARIASLEALLFAEHQSLRAVLAGESHRVRSTVTGESHGVQSGISAEMKEHSQLVHQELAKLGQLLAGQGDAIRSLGHELAKARRPSVLRTLRRWLGRSDA